MPKYQTTYANSYALLVAIDDYHHLGSLKNAVRGANALAELLTQSFGFKVDTLFNDHITQQNILDWFISLECNDDDRVIFYFAGHGLTRQVRNREFGYLALPSTQLTQYSTALKLDYLIQEVETLTAKHVLVFLDACFSGLALKRARSGQLGWESEIEKFVDELISRPVRYAITAGGIERVDDNAGPDGNYSLFTHYILKGLRGEAQESQGLIRAKTLGNYLEKHVSSHHLARHKPNHGYLTQIGDGDFVFQLPKHLHSDHKSKQCTVLDSQNLLEQHSISILQKLTKSNKITILEKITIGQSGSAVYLVDITTGPPHGSRGLHFCKIYRTPTGKEKQIHETVYKTKIQKHIPKLIDSTPLLDGWMASIYAVAHRTTLKSSQSLSNLIHQNMLAAVDVVRSLTKILEIWNPFPFIRQHSAPHALLRLPLQRYLKSSITMSGNIVERIESLVEPLSADTFNIQFATQVLPNPVAFLSSYDLWQNARSISWPCGNIHGDLHSNNIIGLIGSETKTISNDPVIIDFDTYENNGSLFFDLAYLEVDLAMRMLSPESKINREIWLKASQFLVQNIILQEIPPLAPQYQPLHTLLIPLRIAVHKICQDQPGDFEVAYWIARISTALSFARKRKITTAERKLVLLIAAHSLSKVLKELEIEHRDYTQPVWISWLDDNNLI